MIPKEYSKMNLQIAYAKAKDKELLNNIVCLPIEMREMIFSYYIAMRNRLFERKQQIFFKKNKIFDSMHMYKLDKLVRDCTLRLQIRIYLAYKIKGLKKY